MARGFLAYELFLAIAELPDNKEVTVAFSSANGDVESLVVVGVDSSFGRAELIVDDPNGSTPHDVMKQAREKLVAFWNQHFEGDLPLPPCPLNTDLKKLLDELFDILPEE